MSPPVPLAIYTNLGGSLVKVIDIGDSLDGKTVTFLFFGSEGLSGNSIAFLARFTDGSLGIFVAELDSLPPDGDGGECSGGECEPGDANGDGLINILDVTAILNDILGVSAATGNGDCSEDGQVNILDVTCVLNIILGG